MSTREDRWAELDAGIRKGMRPALEPSKALKRRATDLTKAVAHTAEAGGCAPAGGINGTTLGSVFGHLRVLEQTMDDVRAAAVTAARAGGSSWTEIGRHLGVSKQAAVKRFGHLDPRP